ncbi:hypothetical protein F2Q68_00012576 [Brassica cretica]|uniref:Uncharacterized protein n=1 Tax=Brassica cretica TaxID=69181 RepID=A0A8S9L105_BRACR|nr:hypothetical protein F2Q68_00012576 [Brassica cretica]
MQDILGLGSCAMMNTPATEAAKRLVSGNGELKSKLQDFRLDPSIIQGVITKDVVELRKSIGAPGMAVLQFDNHSSDSIVLHAMKYLSVAEEDDISWSLIQSCVLFNCSDLIHTDARHPRTWKLCHDEHSSH